MRLSFQEDDRKGFSKIGGEVPFLLRAGPKGQLGLQQGGVWCMKLDQGENQSLRSLAYRARRRGSHAWPSGLSGNSMKTIAQGSHE